MSCMLRMISQVLSDDGTYAADAYKMPFVRYMLMWRAMPSVKTLILGQDPYRSDIFPYYAPAFAYDIDKLGAVFTPSVEMFVEAARHQIPNAGAAYARDLVECMANSHTLLPLGYIVTNASYNYRPADREKVHQVIALAEVIRELVVTRPDWKSQSIRIFAFGSLAGEAASMIASSLNKDIRVSVTRCIHPAALARMALADRVRVGYFGNVGVVRMLTKMVSNYVGTERMASTVTMKDLMTYIGNYTSRIKKDNSIVRDGLRALKEKVVDEGKVEPTDIVELIGIFEESLTNVDASVEFIGYTGALLHSVQSYEPPQSARRGYGGGAGNDITRDSRGKLDLVGSGSLRGLSMAPRKTRNPFEDSDNEEEKEEKPDDSGGSAIVVQSHPPSVVKPKVKSIFSDSDEEAPSGLGSSGRGKPPSPARPTKASRAFAKKTGNKTRDPFSLDSDEEDGDSAPFSAPPVGLTTSQRTGRKSLFEDSDTEEGGATGPANARADSRIIDITRYTERDDLADEAYLASVRTPPRTADLDSVASSVPGKVRVPADVNVKSIQSTIMLADTSMRQRFTTLRGRVAIKGVREILQEAKESVEKGVPFYIDHGSAEACRVIQLIRSETRPARIVSDKDNPVRRYIEELASI